MAALDRRFWSTAPQGRVKGVLSIVGAKIVKTGFSIEREGASRNKDYTKSFKI
jgi:hypothetical protein